jgi:GTP cyclohydrolase I
LVSSSTSLPSTTRRTATIQIANWLQEHLTPKGVGVVVVVVVVADQVRTT